MDQEVQLKTENFLDALKANFVANYAEFLEDQPGELSDFKNIELGGRDPFNCKKYPTLMIHLSGDDPEWESLTSVEGELRVDLAISVTHPKADTAHRFQLRYSEAIKEMVSADQTLGNIALISGLQNIRHYPPGAGGQGGPAVSVLELIVKL